jgi:hypothetical protein
MGKVIANDEQLRCGIEEIEAYFKIVCHHSAKRLDKATKNLSQLNGNPTEIRKEYLSNIQVELD